jgi:hypothetical protein
VRASGKLKTAYDSDNILLIMAKMVQRIMNTGIVARTPQTPARCGRFLFLMQSFLFFSFLLL